MPAGNRCWLRLFCALSPMGQEQATRLGFSCRCCADSLEPEAATSPPACHVPVIALHVTSCGCCTGSMEPPASRFRLTTAVSSVISCWCCTGSLELEPAAQPSATWLPSSCGICVTSCRCCAGSMEPEAWDLGAPAPGLSRRASRTGGPRFASRLLRTADEDGEGGGPQASHVPGVLHVWGGPPGSLRGLPRPPRSLPARWHTRCVWLLQSGLAQLAVGKISAGRAYSCRTHMHRCPCERSK